MLHPVVRWLSRRAIRWFYGSAEFANAENIPASGATLVVASHGNDLPDILLTFLAFRRDLLFVANIAAADSPLVRWTYAGLGVIPVSRVRDARALKARGEDASALNANAFVRVVEALKQGHAVAIFPEGVVTDFPRLGPLRNGAAKMALQAVDEGVSLTMVPVGYQYESAQQLRSGVLGVIGAPVDVTRWRPGEATKRVSEFTAFIAAQLSTVTRNSRTHHDDDVLVRVSVAAGAALRSASQTTLAAAHVVQRRLSLLSAADGIYVAGAVAPSAVDQRDALLQFESDALALSQAAAKFGARPWSSHDVENVLTAADAAKSQSTIPDAAVLLLLAPVAAIGFAWHAVPWLAARAVAFKFAPRPVERAAITIVPGLYIVVCWYIIGPLMLVALGASSWIVAILFVAQPRLGDIAMWWRDKWRTRRLVARVRASSTETREEITHLRNTVQQSWSALG